MKKFYLLLIPFIMICSCMKENTEIRKAEQETLANLELTNDEMKSLLYMGDHRAISEETAVEAAKKFFSQNVKTGTKAENVAVSQVYTIENDVVTKGEEAAIEGPVAYAVNFGDKEGFVIMTADPLESEIAMYSNNGNFDAGDEFMRFMVENMKYSTISKAQQNKKLNEELAEKTLEKISKHSGISADIIRKTYDSNIFYGEAPEKAGSGFLTKGGMPEYYYEVRYTEWQISSQAGPLLTTKMHRGAPYNAGITAYGVQHNASPDAIAIGQIMAYYEKPERYTWKDTLRIFNWPQIKADYWTDSVAYNREVAVFIGSVHTMLNVMPSTPIASEVKYAVYNTLKGALLNAGFVYSPKRVYLHSDENREGRNSIYSDLDKSRPVYMYGQGGNPSSPTKYSWVIDGYQRQQRLRSNIAFYYDYEGNKIYEPNMNTSSLQVSDYWHFNLGISSSCLDLYCNVDSFIFTTPIGYDFNTVKNGICSLYVY